LIGQVRKGESPIIPRQTDIENRHAPAGRMTLNRMVDLSGSSRGNVVFGDGARDETV
jgi:hypothetical protein